ncbi:MAG: succinate dehydrogenase, hydrophobic membrane anchor protein [Caldimonas sp.]
MSGLRAWLVQRISAVYMLVFLVLLLLHFLLDPPRTYGAWHGWVARPSIGVAILVFFGALIVHAWVGLRDVILDYVRPVAVRATALSLLGFALVALGFWVAGILWRLPA